LLRLIIFHHLSMWKYLAITSDNRNLIIEATRPQGGASR
jgi:hypothetical protein